MRLYKNIFSLLTLGLLLAACSSIDEDERLTYVKPADVNRKVLIEDFTGQRCVNCPLASDEIAKLQETYGEENVIAVGIHSGPLGFHGNAKVLGLATDQGDEYYNYWKVDKQPYGMVNRQGLLDYDRWQGAVKQQISQTAPLKIELEVDEVESASWPIHGRVKLTAIDGNVTGKLQIWVVEDSITALQLMPDGSQNYNYVHRHVFRKALNGAWGEEVQVVAGKESDIKGFNVDAEADWKLEHLAVVAFVYNDSGVLQAECKPVVITKKE